MFVRLPIHSNKQSFKKNACFPIALSVFEFKSAQNLYPFLYIPNSPNTRIVASKCSAYVHYYCLIPFMYAFYDWKTTMQ